MTRRPDPALIETTVRRLLTAAWPYLPQRERQEARAAVYPLGLDVAELLPDYVHDSAPPAPAAVAQQARCERKGCGNTMPVHAGGGRRRRYCSDACRTAANRARRARDAEIAAYRPDPDPEVAALVALYAPGAPPPFVNDLRITEDEPPMSLLDHADAMLGLDRVVAIDLWPTLADQFGRIYHGRHSYDALRERGYDPIVTVVPVADDREFLTNAAISLFVLGAGADMVALRDRIFRALGKDDMVSTNRVTT